MAHNKVRIRKLGEDEMPRGGKPMRSEQEEREIVQLYADGTPVPQINSAYGTHDSTVYRLLKKYDVPTHQKTNGKKVAKELEVKADAEGIVQETTPIVRPKGMEVEWEIEYIGVLRVNAESIDQALTEARRHRDVRRITSARMRSV